MDMLTFFLLDYSDALLIGLTDVSDKNCYIVYAYLLQRNYVKKFNISDASGDKS